MIARIAAAVMAFLAVSAAIRALVPWPPDMQLASRFAHLRDSPAYDAVYFGSSQVFRSFVPERIDRDLARRGHALRSFNFGVPGTNAFELDMIIDSVLALDTRPRWVVFEYGFYGHEHPDRILAPFNYFTDRAVFWHTPRRALDVLGVVAGADLPGDHRLELAGIHARHAGWRLASVGQGGRIARAIGGRAADASPVLDDGVDYARTRGYEPLEAGRGVSTDRDHERFVDDPSAYLETIRVVDAVNARPYPVAGIDTSHLQGLVQSIRDAGAQPVLVVTAFPYATPALFALEQAGELPPLIALNSPRRFPALYRPEQRFDGLHLNAQGAQAFSDAFAALFADLLDRTRAASNP